MIPPGIAPVPWIFLPAVALMISWPYLRIITPWTASSGYLAATPMTLRIAGSASKPNSRSGRDQVEEVQRVRLEDLPVVHQPAHLLGRRRELLAADDAVHGLGGGQVVADRADAAQALDQHRHFPERPALDEALEAAELDDVQAGLLHLVLLVEQDRDLAVPLDAGHRLDDDAFEAVGFVLATTVNAPAAVDSGK